MKIISFCIVTLLAVFAIGGSSAAPTAPASAPAAIEDSATTCDTEVAVGESCGGVICGKNQHCCNASCGRCAPIGVECPQVACGADEQDL